ncbi:chaperone protein dnaJ 20, chloroplastic [Ricinus communis]|uniref:Chaperone protein dnaJ 20, chloroplast, putative n=1 Tax=Ricinus communis TaxID=3988 RepID=B9RWC0_RICCO|nr:chaperone protein dnaJ 20, chloroplastic [Ricinus communis]EEF44172.1 Chaperone protein dnaJ 20, chloroplast precursor, putative [Ricinus communis]|eukprot:XP_002518039.1 chaperone protein dnaJ 20, chloroplastic [Ricinus communis]
MHCTNLMLPGGSDTVYFFHPSSSSSTTPITKSKPGPFLRLKPVTRFPMSSFKTKAAVSDRIATKDLSFYELLGIPESGSLIDIKQAYKQLARKYHPDVSPPDRVHEYTQRFIQVQEAYETLSDPRRRATYDRDMARGLHLAFSARRRYQSDEEVEVSSDWKNRWEAQLSELKRRSMNKDSEENMSWAARMRRQRERLSKEL